MGPLELTPPIRLSYRTARKPSKKFRSLAGGGHVSQARSLTELQDLQELAEIAPD